MPDDLKTRIATLTAKVAAHDLTFDYSDDGEARRRGSASLDAIIDLARQVPFEVAMGIWTQKCNDGLSKQDDRERFIMGFMNRAFPAEPEPPEPPRKPRVLKTVTVPPDAGWSQTRERELEAVEHKRWSERLQRIIRLQIAMFDTDEESQMDLMQLADAQCRMFDNIMELKTKKGLEVRSLLAAIERAGKNQLEFNDVEWSRLDDQLRLLRRSYVKMEAGFKAALMVRHAVAGFTGSRWGEYTRASEFKARKAQDNRLRMSAVDASTAVGLNETQFASWQRWRLAYDPAVDGVDGDPDLPGGTGNDVKALADRQHQQQLAEAGSIKKYLRRKPTVVPKKDVSFEPSGERGSRFAKLAAEVKAAKKK